MVSLIQVKICGLRREEDVDYTNELQPDYGGFVFAKSKRQLDMYQAKALIEKLDKSIKKVGVFSNHSEMRYLIFVINFRKKYGKALELKLKAVLSN